MLSGVVTSHDSQGMTCVLSIWATQCLRDW